MEHAIKDCFKVQNKEKKKLVKNGKSTEEVDVNFAEINIHDDQLLVSIYDQKPRSKWILDSGCSYHMMPNRDWITNFKPFNGEMISMGNSSFCQGR